MEINNCQAATFALFRRSGEVLMQKRDDGNGTPIPYPNMWTIPGGGVEERESPLQTVVREAKEEFDLDISPKAFSLAFTYVHDDVVDAIFLCLIEDEPELVLREGADMKWMTLEEVKVLSLAWGQAEILEELEESFVAYISTR